MLARWQVRAPGPAPQQPKIFPGAGLRPYPSAAAQHPATLATPTMGDFRVAPMGLKQPPPIGTIIGFPPMCMQGHGFKTLNRLTCGACACKKKLGLQVVELHSCHPMEGSLLSVCSCKCLSTAFGAGVPT